MHILFRNARSVVQNCRLSRISPSGSHVNDASFFHKTTEPRCEQKKIVQMLHAVHLLLTEAGHDTPIIVLLAVDPRIIEAAVEDSFGLALRKEVPLRAVVAGMKEKKNV